jgi:hypothetical protein
LYFWRTRDGEEVDFLVELQTAGGPRWIALEAKFAIQNVVPLFVPRALSTQLPALHEIWIVTPGGDETRLSASSRQVPIQRLAQRLSDEAAAIPAA